ncbi:MAG: hypothetical protein WD883_02730 [Candidatus Colwellbacteria bacterium]
MRFAAGDGSTVQIEQGNVIITFNFEWDGDKLLRTAEEAGGNTRQKAYQTTQRAEGRDAYWVGDFQGAMRLAIAVAMDRRARFLKRSKEAAQLQMNLDP